MKLKVFEKDEKKKIRLVQNLTMGEADFNLLMRLRNQLAIVEDFVRRENLPPMLTPTLSKNMDEQHKLAHKIVDIVDRANTIFFISISYSVFLTCSVLSAKTDPLVCVDFVF